MTHTSPSFSIRKDGHTWALCSNSQTGRAIKDYGWVDRSRLDAIGSKRFDHQTRIANAIKESLAAAKREMSIELAPVRSLPKRIA